MNHDKKVIADSTRQNNNSFINMTTPTDKFIEEKVQEFYSVFAGNKFEGSYKRIKKNEDGTLTPYFIDDWIRDTLQAQRAEMVEKRIKRCEGMKKQESLPPDLAGNIHSLPINTGYNQALQDIIASDKEVLNSIEEIPQMK